MSQSIEGVYRNGKVELSQHPHNAENVRVVVTFHDEEAKSTSAEASEHERLEAIDASIAQMKSSPVTGGRGYLFREEIYADRLDRRR